ncbi:MAG: ABC transporter ATP-binding protein/permease [Halanaerobiales bacterium]|nr:ABC transporter ATP-binding protein/permease [Halanaerobiales bacterium]
MKYVPAYLIISIVLFALKGTLQSLFNVWLVEHIIDNVIGQNSFTNIIRPLLLFCLYALILGVFNAFFLEIIEKVSRQNFSDKMHMAVYEKAINCDIDCYDSADFYNNFVWTSAEIDNRVFAFLQSLVSILLRVVVISSTIVLLTKTSWWILIVVFISCFYAFIFTLKQNKKQFELNQLINDLSRKKNYVRRTFNLREYAKELRTSKISEVLLAMFEQTNEEIKEKVITHTRLTWKLDFFKKLIGEDVLVTLVTIFFLSFQVIVTKTLTIGSFLGAYNGVGLIYSSFSYILGRAAEFSDHAQYTEKFKQFWFYESKIKSKPNAVMPAKTDMMGFQDVEFAYDKTQTAALQDISLQLSGKEKIAIVGANGAGKTTLIKLLLRLYETGKGYIYHNQQDIKELELAAYRKRFSCLFQDFNLYACTLGENIAMRPLGEEGAALEKMINKAGFGDKYKRLPDGLHTVITREFNNSGTILSGGEKQKVAIARVIYQDADCYILDEPTSALDPIAEAEFNQAIMSFAEDKMLLIISHRLTTTRFVDKILVLDQGKLIEVGTHQELLALNGKYALLYRLQANQYQREQRKAGKLD